MTAASTLRYARTLARSLEFRDEVTRERVLAAEPVEVRDAALAHLAALDRWKTQRKQETR